MGPGVIWGIMRGMEFLFFIGFLLEFGGFKFWRGGFGTGLWGWCAGLWAVELRHFFDIF